MRELLPTITPERQQKLRHVHGKLSATIWPTTSRSKAYKCRRGAALPRLCYVETIRFFLESWGILIRSCVRRDVYHKSCSAVSAAIYCNAPAVAFRYTTNIRQTYAPAFLVP